MPSIQALEECLLYCSTYNEIPPEIQVAPTLLVFQSILKPKLFAQAFDCDRIGLFKKESVCLLLSSFATCFFF